MVPKRLERMLLLMVAVLVMGTGIAVSQLVVHNYSASLLSAAAARAETIAHKLALQSADAVLINDRVALQKMLENQIASDPSTAYLFILRQGTLLAHTFTDGVPAQLLEANHPASPSSGRVAKIVSETGLRYIDVAFPIFEGKGGTLRLGMSEQPFRKQARQLWMRMNALTLGVLAVALFAGHWMVGRLVRPLQQLTRYAEQLDAGDLNRAVTIHGSQEINKLAAAFNAMLARIQQHTAQLRDYTRQLEEKNHELDRTHKQLKTSFSISQQIAALPRLDQICRYLIGTLRDIVACRQYCLLVFNHAMRTVTLTAQDHTRHLDHTVYEGLSEVCARHGVRILLARADVVAMGLPEHLTGADQVGLFPIRHHEMVIGAMAVPCPDDCKCMDHELNIVTMILHQAAGAIQRAERHEETLLELRQRVDNDSGLGVIIGKDPKMQVVFKLIEDVAPTDATVLIQGESGTGKELVAREIHDRSGRAENPFVVINCAAYPSTLLESELFGHEKGAFTGALRRKTGRFELADGGTVFLDEISEIEPTAQTKLLRVLQQQTIDRVGGEKPIKVDVRILAATNKNLLNEVQQGRFREDLFYRLNVIPIHLPPLRERRMDIHLLMRHFLERFALAQGKQIVGFRNEALRCLLDSAWPGNVRELENCIEHAVVLSKGDHIELKDLPAALTPQTAIPSEMGKMAATESRLIHEVLEACAWNKTKAARQLGIGRSTLYEKIKRLNIRRTGEPN